MTGAVAAAPRLQRTQGRAHVGFRAEAGRTRLADLHQQGAAKVRLPSVHAGPPEAVLVNTAGGLTDGDHLKQSVTLETGAQAVVTSQACEKLYRARGLEPARIENRLEIGSDARLLWLPQETILFQGGRLARRLDAEIAPGGRLLACEAILLGRAAMGERPDAGDVRESWTVRAGGVPLFAERSRIGGTAERGLTDTTRGPATLNGRAACATIVLAAPGDDACIIAAVDAARTIAGPAEAEIGVSGWDGRLVARLVAPGGLALRARLVPLLEALAGVALDLPGPARLPKVWAL